MEILQELRGCPNIVSLITAVEDQQVRIALQGDLGLIIPLGRQDISRV
jgi:hypothetical protein